MESAKNPLIPMPLRIISLRAFGSDARAAYAALLTLYKDYLRVHKKAETVNLTLSFSTVTPVAPYGLPRQQVEVRCHYRPEDEAQAFWFVEAIKGL